MKYHDYVQEPALPHQRLPYPRISEEIPDLGRQDRRFAETTLRRGRNRLAGRFDEATRWVAERHNLDIADIYEMFACYQSNPETMRRVEERHERAVAEAKERSSLTPPEN